MFVTPPPPPSQTQQDRRWNAQQTSAALDPLRQPITDLGTFENSFTNIEKRKKSGVSGWTDIENPYWLPRG